jgi:hypothetical protein
MPNKSDQYSIRISIDASDLAPDATSGRAHSVWRERLTAGLISGTVVVCWLILYDALTTGNPWLTAEHIGSIFARQVFGAGRSPTIAISLVFFCVVHYAVWIANASFVIGVVHRGEKQPSILTSAFILSILLYVPFIGLIAMLVEMGAGSGAYMRFLLGALIGGVTVVAQAYRMHPGLVHYELAHLDDDED